MYVRFNRRNITYKIFINFAIKLNSTDHEKSNFSSKCHFYDGFYIL